jgi:hypothetical protein
LADPPRVHPWAPAGVFSTDRAFYYYLRSVLRPTDRTLEIGVGVSSVIFALAGVRHTAFFLDASEGDVLAEWFDRKQIRNDIELVAGPSQLTLPVFEPEAPLDVIFVDGNHGFPFPMLDFFFAARWLREGGLFLLDDIPLPAPGMLYAVLAHDKRWRLEERTRQWAAFRLLVSYPLDQEWCAQGLRMGHIAATMLRESLRAKCYDEPRRAAGVLYRRFRPVEPPATYGNQV